MLTMVMLRNELGRPERVDVGQRRSVASSFSRGEPEGGARTRALASRRRLPTRAGGRWSSGAGEDAAPHADIEQLFSVVISKKKSTQM